MNKFEEIRPIVLGLAIKDSKLLVGESFDKVKNQTFYRCLGGGINFLERSEDALKRELLEETGIEITNYKLFDSDSVTVKWKFKGDLVQTHHIGIFFTILNYNNEVKKEVKIDEINDDSLGAEFFDINKLSKKELSVIAILELEKLGYTLKN